MIADIWAAAAEHYDESQLSSLAARDRRHQPCGTA
jgi:hypothetical protein